MKMIIYISTRKIVTEIIKNGIGFHLERLLYQPEKEKQKLLRMDGNRFREIFILTIKYEQKLLRMDLICFKERFLYQTDKLYQEIFIESGTKQS